VVIPYVLLTVTALIALRALVDELDFISVGWILVLAALPLLPWLLPRLGDFLKSISPYVESLKLGAVQIDLRAVRRDAISVPPQGVLATVPNDVAALSTGTGIQELVSAFRDFRRRGAGPVVVIDLQDGDKWRLSNLYFLTRLLETEPVITELVFSEARGGIDGYVVGSCHPRDFREQVERTVTGYGDASGRLGIPVARDLKNAAQAQLLGDSYKALVRSLGPPGAASDEWVTPERIRTILGGFLNTVAVELGAATLDDKDVRAVIQSPHRFVPATSGGRLSGLIDREAVSLLVARAAIAETSRG
jgi:hypothetical protein